MKGWPCCILLWGSKAIQAKKLLTNPKHLILTSPHPSPLSAYRGFFGNNHFKLANEYLIKTMKRLSNGYRRFLIVKKKKEASFLILLVFHFIEHL